MEQRLSPIKLDSYQPLREVVCESLREAIRKGVLKPASASWKSSLQKNSA